MRAAQAERLLRDLDSARGGFSFETVLQYRFKAAREFVTQQLKQGGAGRAAGVGHDSKKAAAGRASEDKS